jgi:hypothetical protein
MDEMKERGRELEQECKIRRLLVERNLANTETNRAIMEKIIRRQRFRPPVHSESSDDHVWISRLPKISDSLRHNLRATSDTHEYNKQPMQSSSQKLKTLTAPVQVYEVTLDTGSIQRWHMPVPSLSSRLAANIRSSHYVKVIAKERDQTTKI